MDKRQLSIAVFNAKLANKNLKQEYISRTNDKEYAECINPEVTLADIFMAINKGESIDNMIDDSFVREQAFEAISDYTNIPYDYMYYMWLNRKKEALIALRLN